MSLLTYDHTDCITLFCCVQELRNDAELQEGNLGWLKARMAVLIEICADSDGQRQGSALSKLSTDFKGLLASLLEVGEAFTCLTKVPDTNQTPYPLWESPVLKYDICIQGACRYKLLLYV